MSDRDDRRRALNAPMADRLIAHGLAGASLRPFACVAGTSDRMPLYYFADRDAVMAAVLDAPDLTPYLALWLALADTAARGQEPYRRIGARIPGGVVDRAAVRIAAPTPAASWR